MKKGRNTRTYHGVRSKHSRWSPEEDAAIMEYVRDGKVSNGFREIDISRFHNKTVAQISQRWKSVLDPRIKKGQWTKEEDEMILDWVSKNGKNQWKELESLFNNERNRKQLRERYSVLNSNRMVWNEEEDNLLIEMVNKYGNKWSLIGKKIKREQNQVKNRWYSTIKKRQERLQWEMEPILKRGRKKKSEKNIDFDFPILNNNILGDLFF